MILSAWSVSGSTRYWVGPACTRAEVVRARTRTREDSIFTVIQLVMVLQLVVTQLVMVQLVVIQLVWCHLHTAARWCGLVFTTNQSCTTTTHPLLPRPEEDDLQTHVHEDICVTNFECPPLFLSHHARCPITRRKEKKRNTNEHIFTYLAHCIIVVLHGIQILL